MDKHFTLDTKERAEKLTCKHDNKKSEDNWTETWT